MRVRLAVYIGACTTMEGLNWLTTNKFLLRRIEITERDIGWRFRLKLRIGREILRWPPVRPPEMLLALEWLRRKRAQKTFRIIHGLAFLSIVAGAHEFQRESNDRNSQPGSP